MLNRAKRFVVLLVLAVLPVQGISASFVKLACHTGSGEHTAGAHVHDGHDHAPQGHSHSDDGKDGDPERFSCHHLTAVLPAATLPARVTEFPAWAPSSYGLPDLYIPDRPQRPPLA
jgi:hypothetical protein